MSRVISDRITQEIRIRWTLDEVKEILLREASGQINTRKQFVSHDDQTELRTIQNLRGDQLIELVYTMTNDKDEDQQ